MSSDKGLTTGELQMLLNCMFCRKIPAFVIASDETEVVQVDLFPCCIIQNTKPKNHPGEHWIAYWIPKKNSYEYFDSFGNSIDTYSVEKPPGVMVMSNDRVLQCDNTSTCGDFCLFFLYYRYRSSFTSVMKRFVNNKVLNNRKVITLYKIISKRCAKSSDRIVGLYSSCSQHCNCKL